MKPASAKAKGKAAEREIADIMTKLSGKKYRRVPMSGALHQDFPFDVMKVERGPSVFDRVGNEVKNQKTLCIPQWIEQVKISCEDAGLIFNPKWFLAFKWKTEWFFLINQNYFEDLIKAKREKDSQDQE